ncbi:hypothetical protein QO001_006468 [Methylobacterium brachiatum]|uniref:Uncharacterized protein n=1 Tax=Methylobacterium brachiatum TaxID=269660 RepID=A0AAJ1TZ56_9HYPH|nr:hypothetical protein [Methylobacterium brachiatum]MCB4806496.1 hypothetical protein [Methylobacterium brachiatum]MDQ0547509.1 hypothetical protein [Methylobacterium brachiatum]
MENSVPRISNVYSLFRITCESHKAESDQSVASPESLRCGAVSSPIIAEYDLNGADRPCSRRGSRGGGPPRRLARALLAAGTFTATAAVAGPAPTSDWLDAYTQEATTAPVTLENAVKYRWYQISAADRGKHPFVDIAPAAVRLRQHGDAALPELKRQLDARCAAVRSLDEAGPFHAQCGWIMQREPGQGVSQVQIDLEGYCRDRAMPALYLRLVRERAQALGVRLATLPTLDVAYPSRAVGTAGTVGHEDVPAAYVRALDERLAAAQPVVIGELAEHFRTKVIGDDPLRTDGAQCRDLLGRWYAQPDPVRDMALNDPLRGVAVGSEAGARFGQAVGGGGGRREAQAWLMRQQPGIDAAIRAGLAALDPKAVPILSVQTRCAAVLGRWFTTFDGFDLALTRPLSQTCREAAAALNAKAIDIRARAVADRFEEVPKTLVGLEVNGWFEPEPDDLQVVHELRDPNRNEVDQALRARTTALVQPMRSAARVAAIGEVISRYENAELDDAGLGPVRRICGPYVGHAIRPLPPGGDDLRKAVGDACREGEKQVGVRRTRMAFAAAHVGDVVGDGMLGLTTPDGRVAFADPRAIVAAVAINGVQVAFRRTMWWLFWSRVHIQITPLGRDAPALIGTLIPETRADGVRVWRVVGLPGLDGPFATMACLTQGHEAADAAVGLGLAGAAALFLFDAPHTGGELIGTGFDIARTSARCSRARQTYLAVTYAAP